jgi:hypothetical protein
MKTLALVVLFAVTASFVSAQTGHPAVYLESKDEFANDFAAGVIKKNVPVILTADRGKAGYVASFSWATNQGSKTQGVMTALATGIYMNGAYERVSMSITDRRSKDLVYSYTCQKGGRHMQSVAECLAKHWKEAFKNGEIQMHEYSAAELAGIQEVTPETVSVRKDSDVTPVQITAHPAAEATPSMVVVSAGPDTESLGDYARRMKAEKDAKQ